MIRNVNLLKVADVSAQFRDLMHRTSTGQLGADDLTAGTFTISNTGMFGVKSLAAIVSPGQSCSLGIGAIERVVVPSNDGTYRKYRFWRQAYNISIGHAFQTATRMQATLACDHRVVDGAVGGQWLAAFKSLVENPVQTFLNNI